MKFTKLAVFGKSETVVKLVLLVVICVFKHLFILSFYLAACIKLRISDNIMYVKNDDVDIFNNEYAFRMMQSLRNQSQDNLFIQKLFQQKNYADSSILSKCMQEA